MSDDTLTVEQCQAMANTMIDHMYDGFEAAQKIKPSGIPTPIIGLVLAAPMNIVAKTHPDVMRCFVNSLKGPVKDELFKIVKEQICEVD